MKPEYESILTLKDSEGRIIAFYRNDFAARSVKMYSCKELSLDEIKELHETYYAKNNEKTARRTTQANEGGE